MKRNAFTMIELIFVIVIIGILAGVAIPRFFGVQKQAQESILFGFTGTLNRTAGQALWSRSLSDGNGGSINKPEYANVLARYIKIPEGSAINPDLTQCNIAGNGLLLSYSAVTYGRNFEVHCKDGTATTAPIFRLFNVDDATYVDF